MPKHLLSVIETPLHRDFSALYAEKGYAHTRVDSMRKAISHVKRHPVDLVVADFLYGYGNDYAGVTVSNVDVLMYSLQRYCPGAKVILLADKSEQQYVAKLPETVEVEAVLLHPVGPQDIAPCL